MTTIPELQDAINTFWVLIGGICCFLLQAGFGLLEVGSVRAKNAKNIMLKNLLDACVCAIAYWALGFGLAFGDGGNGFAGFNHFFMVDFDKLGPSRYVIWFFQYTFAGTTATIVSGAVAERCRFRAYLIYSSVLSALIYPIASHWVWAEDGPS